MKRMKVNICGIPHKIISAKDNFDCDVHFGQIDYKKCEITVNEDLSAAAREETICHEIIHGIFIHIGREDLSNDEHLVQSLANAINQSFDIRIMDEQEGE